MSTSMAATQILRQFCASAGPASQSNWLWSTKPGLDRSPRYSMCLSPFPTGDCPDSANVSPRARRTARIILKAAAPAPWQGHWKQLRVSAPRPSSRPLQRARSGRGLSRQHYGPRARHLRRLAEVKVARQLGADVIGASIVLEVIIARTLGLRVAALAVVTPFGAGFRAATQTLRKPLQAPSA
jgi:hypothetical protein